MKCYISILSVRLWIILCALIYTNKHFWRRCQENGCWVNFEPSLSLYHYSFILLSFLFLFTMDLESTPIYQYGAPMSVSLQPKESSKPILTPGYELCPCLINMVQDQPFSGEDNENPYSHLYQFEQTYACLRIAGMLDKTLRWKLFPFSLMGKDKCWYNLIIGSR